MSVSLLIMNPLPRLLVPSVLAILAGCAPSEPSPLMGIPVIARTTTDTATGTTYRDQNGDRRIDHIRVADSNVEAFEYIDTDFDGRWDLVRHGKGSARTSRQPTAADLQKVEQSLSRYLENELTPVP